MANNKINICIGVATGLLIGFVFGTVYGTSGESLDTSGKSAGNVSALSIRRLEKIEAAKEQKQADTLRFTMTDNKGEEWKMTITK